MENILDESAIDAAFWHFDAARTRTGAERDAFTHTMRALIRAHLAMQLGRAQTLMAEAELYVRAYQTGCDAPQGKDGARQCLRTIGDFINATV